jgi:hypothetical protein
VTTTDSIDRPPFPDVSFVAEAANDYRLLLETQGWEPEVVNAMSAYVLWVWTMRVLKP